SLYTIYFAVRVDLFYSESNAADQTATTDGAQNNFCIFHLFHDFQTNCTLTSHYVFIVEGVQECVAFFLLQLCSFCSSIIIYAGNQHYFCAIASCSFYFSHGCGFGHANYSRDTFFLSSQSYALSVVTCGASNYTFLSFCVCQASCFEVSASQFERTCYLHVFTFDINISIGVDVSGLEYGCFSS